MFANAYQNGACLEVWDSKGTSFSTQSTLPKTSSTGNWLRQPLPTLEPSIGKSKVTFILCRDKILDFRSLQKIINNCVCINVISCCKSSFQ